MFLASRRSLSLFAAAGLVMLALLIAARDAQAVDIPEECFTPTCPYEVGEITDGLDFPVDMQFLPDGRLLIAQKGGEILQWDGEDLEPWGEVPSNILNVNGERGLLGIAVDTKFETNKRVYLYYTRDGSGVAIPTVAYFRETAGGVAGSLVDVLPLEPQTDGGNIHLGGSIHMKGSYLYVSVGDYGDASNAEDRDVPMGKILKLRRSGDSAPNPPYGEGDGGWDEYVWARGLRNSFDFTEYPGSGTLYGAENGPSNCDEINGLQRGRNYGWAGSLSPAGNTCMPDRGQPALVNPHTDSAGIDPWDNNSTIAPTGITVYTADDIAGWQGDLFYCSWVEGKMRHANVSGGVITGQQIIDEANCTLDVIEGPDGELWFTDADTLYAIVPS